MLADLLFQFLEQLRKCRLAFDLIAGKDQRHRVQPEFTNRRMESANVTSRDHPGLKRPRKRTQAGGRLRQLLFISPERHADGDEDADNNEWEGTKRDCFPRGGSRTPESATMTRE